jgi:hypothetical protein
MRTQPVVIDLGNRGGKIVRLLPIETYPDLATNLQTLCYAYQAGVIDDAALEYWLEVLGYDPRQVEFLTSFWGRR